MKATVVTRRGSRHAILAIVDQCFFTGTNFVTALIVARIGGAAQMGIYSLAFSVIVLIMAMQRSLLVSPYVIHRGDWTDHRSASVRRSIWLITLLAGLTMVGVGGLFAVLASGTAWHGVAWAMMVAAPAALVRDLIRRIAISEYRFATAIGMDVAIATVQLGGLWLLVQWRPDCVNASKVLCWSGAVWGVIGTLMYVLNSQRYAGSRLVTVTASTVKSDFDGLWPVGRWLAIGQAIAVGQSYALPWILTLFHSVEAAGIYAACWTLVQVVSPAIEGFGNVLSPSLASSASRRDWSELSRRVTMATLFFGGLMTVLLLAVLLAGRWVLNQLYGPEFAAMFMVLWLLTISASIQNVAFPAAKALTQLGHAAANTWISGIGLAIVMIGSIAFLMSVGVTGAAWGLVLGNTFATLVRFGMYKQRTETITAS